MQSGNHLGTILDLLILMSLVLLPGCSPDSALPTPQPTATIAATPAGTGVSPPSPAFQYGTASISPADSVVASSWGTWTITYIAGPAGLRPGSRIRVELPVFSSDAVYWWPGQAADPKAVCYVSAGTSRPGSRARVRYAGRGYEQNLITVELSGEPLQEGDRVTLVYGDTSQGAPRGCHVPEWGAPRRQRFVVKVNPAGSGRWIPLPNPPELQLMAERARRLVATAEATPNVGEDFRLTVRAVDRLGNLDTRYRGRVTFECSDPAATLPGPYRFTKADQGAHTFTNLRLGSSGTFTITVRDEKNGFVAVSNPISSDWPEDVNIYFGELHVHSQLHHDRDISDGSDLDYLYWWGRDVIGLDFVAATNHAEYLTDEEWRITQAKAAEYYEPGRFVTFSAYEWTCSAAATEGRCDDGHRNVYYLTDDQPLYRATDPASDTMAELAELLSDRPALAVPHHPTDGVHPMDWDTYRPEVEPLVEIYQVRRCAEGDGPAATNSLGLSPHPLSVQAALARGYRLGFVAGSDNHLAQPSTPYAHNPKRSQLWHRPGRTAVLAPELTREALFEALRARHTYATTLPNILLDVRADGHLMGDEYRSTIPPALSVRIFGTDVIKEVIIVKNNEDVYIHPGGDTRVEFTWNDPAFVEDSFYYVRVTQRDGNMAWSSPIWVDWGKR